MQQIDIVSIIFHEIRNYFDEVVQQKNYGCFDDD